MLFLSRAKHHHNYANYGVHLFAFTQLSAGLVPLHRQARTFTMITQENHLALAIIQLIKWQMPDF